MKFALLFLILALASCSNLQGTSKVNLYVKIHDTIKGILEGSRFQELTDIVPCIEPEGEIKDSLFRIVDLIKGFDKSTDELTFLIMKVTQQLFKITEGIHLKKGDCTSYARKIPVFIDRMKALVSKEEYFSQVVSGLVEVLINLRTDVPRIKEFIKNDNWSLLGSTIGNMLYRIIYREI